MSFEQRFRKYIERFELVKHPTDEGFFRQTHEGEEVVQVVGGNKDHRLKDYPAYNSIKYLICAGEDAESVPHMPFHSNESDILHHFHDGWPVTYMWFEPDTRTFVKQVLGPDPFASGHEFTVCVPGGLFHAAWLHTEEKQWANFHNETPFCMLTEQTAPGWRIDDHKLLRKETHGDTFSEIFEQYPQYLSTQ